MRKHRNTRPSIDNARACVILNPPPHRPHPKKSNAVSHHHPVIFAHEQTHTNTPSEIPSFAAAPFSPCPLLPPPPPPLPPAPHEFLSCPQGEPSPLSSNRIGQIFHSPTHTPGASTCPDPRWCVPQLTSPIGDRPLQTQRHLPAIHKVT